MLIYHHGALKSSMFLYDALANIAGIELFVVVPEKIKVDTVYEATEWLTPAHVRSHQRYELISVPLKDPARYNLGFDNKKMWLAIRAKKPDIIHVLDEPYSQFLFETIFLKLTACFRSRVIFYGYDNLPLQIAGLRSSLRWRFVRSQLAGGVVANKEALENIRKEGFSKDKPLERIFWGVPTELFKPMDKEVLRKELSLNHEFIIGYIGRLLSEKGISVLLEAMRQLSHGMVCLIIGNGVMKSELKERAKEPILQGRVLICDAMEPERLVKYLNCMDVLVLPSLTTSQWKEQYGRVISEAMACGIPVVGSDSGAIPEVIGNCGFVTRENDAVALAAAILKIIEDHDLRKLFIKKSLVRVETELSTQVMSNKFNIFYQSILRQPLFRLHSIIYPFRIIKYIIRYVYRITVNYSRYFVIMPIRRFIERKYFRAIKRSYREQCWCGGDIIPFVYHGSYSVCKICGTYVNQHPPMLHELKKLYTFDLYWHTKQRFKGHPTIEKRTKYDRVDGRLEYWLNLIARYVPLGCNVIEVGCAHGALLVELNKLGYRCIGIEPDECTVQWVRKNTGLDIRGGFFPHVDLPPCDLFLAFDVLEHAPEPEIFMRGVARLLRPGGTAIIQAPTDRSDSRPPFGRCFRDTFDDTEHLFIYTDQAMKELAKRSGLYVVSLTERLSVHQEISIFKKQ
ncbi:MAG: glycosyltransferase [Candidatus Omnitrophota bacterium]